MPYETSIYLFLHSTFLDVFSRELKDENGRLRKTVAEKDYEIRRGDKKLAKLEEEKNIIASKFNKKQRK